MSDVVAQEGDTVTLWCISTGTPAPRVTWYQCSHHIRHACTAQTDTGLSFLLSVSPSLAFIDEKLSLCFDRATRF